MNNPHKLIKVAMVFFISVSLFYAKNIFLPKEVFALTYNSSYCGQTVEIENGTYDELVVSASCSSSNPLTVRAQTDGEVIVDGQGSRVPIIISGNYIIIEGLSARNSSNSTINVRGHHVTFRRCSAYNANQNGNYHIWEIGYTNDVLLEDCAGTGTGRYVFLFYDSERVTCRRCWARWQHHEGISPRAPFAIYGSRYVTLENCIGYGAIPNPSNTLQTDYYGLYITYADYNRYLPEGNIISGSIFHNNFHGGVGGVSAGRYDQFVNSVIFDNPYLPCNFSDCPNWSRGYGLDLRQSNGTVSSSTIANNETGLRLTPGTNLVNGKFFICQ
jgi:hypothetical protein